jgi:hypothetical protein
MADTPPTERLAAMADEQWPTAQALGQFRTELTEQGLDDDTVKYLVQTAGRELLVQAGLCLNKEVGRDG